MKEPAIEIHGLTKTYRVYAQPLDRLKEQLFKRAKGREVHALSDIELVINKGETFGIIGENGSGKSTLLQVLAGILQPTSGTVQVHGRVAALLELGSGFNPEYTGRENIVISASVLGMSSEEIERKTQDIIDFSEIGDFIDSPVKTYSSGMFLRLAFSVAISVEADILLIDEALAVGDVFFRQKCYRKLNSLRDAGATIVFVSHSMGEVEQFCERSILLEHGMATYLGNTREAVKRYYLIRQKMNRVQSGLQSDESKRVHFRESGLPDPSAFFTLPDSEQVTDGSARLIRAALCDNGREGCRSFSMRDTASFFVEYEILRDIDIPICGIVLYNESNQIVHGKNTLQYDELEVPGPVRAGMRITVRQDVKLNLQQGEYTFELGLASLPEEIYRHKGEISYHDLDGAIRRHCHIAHAGAFSVILDEGGRRGELMHHGIADLPGSCEIGTRGENDE